MLIYLLAQAEEERQREGERERERERESPLTVSISSSDPMPVFNWLHWTGRKREKKGEISRAEARVSTCARPPAD